MKSILRVACVAILSAAPAAALAQPKDAAPKPVVVAPVVQADVTSGQTFVGTVLPTKRAVVGSAVSGRVVEFPIEVGQRVEEKATLAQVLTDTISLDLAAAEAQLDFRREELRELENGSRPEEVEQSRAQLLSAQASAAYAKARLERTEALARRGGVTEETLDEVRSLAAAAEQAVNEAGANYRLVQAGPREEQVARARANLAMQQATVERIADQIKKHTVITRFAGYVVAEHTEVGAWVNQGDPVAEVVALDEVDVEAYIPENAVPYVRFGQEVRVEVPALPDRLLTGTVAAVSPQADVRTRTFPVKVRVANERGPGGPVVKAGMLARVVLPTGPADRGLLVPKDALVLGGPRPVVYVAAPDPKTPGQATVVPVPVELGVASGERLHVRGDLEPGQNVIVLGNERVRPGEVVRVAETRTE